MLLESVKLQKTNCLCWKSMLSRMFSIICAPLLPATTSWKCYYLYTSNISFEWIPRLNIVHQIVRDLDYSLAIWWCKSNVFHWFSFSAVPLILCLATVATNFFDRNSSTSTFNVLSSWMLLVAVFQSQCNSIVRIISHEKQSYFLTQKYFLENIIYYYSPAFQMS